MWRWKMDKSHRNLAQLTAHVQFEMLRIWKYYQSPIELNAHFFDRVIHDVYSIYFSQRYSREWSFLTKDLLSHMCVKIRSAPTNSTEKIIFLIDQMGKHKLH